MTIGSKFNVGLSNITIDRLTLLSYKIKLDDYIKKNNLWEENVIECWLYDLCDYAGYGCGRRWLGDCDLAGYLCISGLALYDA